MLKEHISSIDNSSDNQTVKIPTSNSVCDFIDNFLVRFADNGKILKAGKSNRCDDNKSMSDSHLEIY